MSASAWQARLTSEDLESFLKEAVMPRTSLALSVAILICSTIPSLGLPHAYAHQSSRATTVMLVLPTGLRPWSNQHETVWCSVWPQHAEQKQDMHLKVADEHPHSLLVS